MARRVCSPMMLPIALVQVADRVMSRDSGWMIMRCPFCHGIPKSSIYFIQCIDVLSKKNIQQLGTPHFRTPPYHGNTMGTGMYNDIYIYAIHDGNVMGLSENLGHLKMIKNCFCIDQP